MFGEPERPFKPLVLALCLCHFVRATWRGGNIPLSVCWYISQWLTDFLVTQQQKQDDAWTFLTRFQKWQFQWPKRKAETTFVLPFFVLYLYICSQNPNKQTNYFMAPLIRNSNCN